MVFSKAWGLRYGDPFSPYLFVIVIEALNYLLKRAKEGGFLPGWKIRGRGREGVEVSHLLFVDDTLVLCKPSLNQITYLSWPLMWFKERLKYSFVCNLWSWVRVSLAESPSFFSCKFFRLHRLLVREGSVYTPYILRGHWFFGVSSF